MNELKAEIRKFVVVNFLFGQDDGFADEASFLEQGIIDSTGVLELVAHLEQTYKFKVADEELIPDNLDSIDSVAAFIGRKSSSSSAASA